jgi:hypothetical protein
MIIQCDRCGGWMVCPGKVNPPVIPIFCDSCEEKIHLQAESRFNVKPNVVREAPEAAGRVLDGRTHEDRPEGKP